MGAAMKTADSTQFGSTRITRRRLLGSAASLAAAAVASSFLPPNVRRALAQPPDRGGLGDIKHVVLLMQENRSFDHYFGTLGGVRGFDDPQALKLPDGRSIFHQPDALHPDGYMLPFRLDTQATSAQKLPSTSHAWSVQHESWNEGKMDSWLPAHRKADGINGPFVMGYHTRADIPFQFALAEAFTICDSYHCSVFGPTWPNRLYWMTGMIDSEGYHGGPVISNHMAAGGFTWMTYAQRLEEAGVSWKVYQEEDNYGCNMLENFKVFRNAGLDSPLWTKGMARGREGQFEHDARNDKLPTVSWIIPASHQCEHPDYMPASGAAFVANKIDAIAANPKVWAKTAFILDYDENDGIFDHVAPPVPPDGTQHEFIDAMPIGAGFRVPCIVVSPWTVGGWVCSEPFDHTSPLRFLEKITGVREENISTWRRKTFGDLSSAFRFGEAKAEPPILPDAGDLLSRAYYGATHFPKPTPPGSGQLMPAQEKGALKRISPRSG
jgi:phospholipase C